MNNEHNPVTVVYQQHTRYELVAEISGKVVRVPMVSVRTLEPLDSCAKGDEIKIEIQSWVLIDNGLKHLVTVFPKCE